VVYSYNALSSCSTHELGLEKEEYAKIVSRLKIRLVQPKKIKLYENWNRKSKKQANKSYLPPNPLLRHLSLNNPKNIRY